MGAGIKTYVDIVAPDNRLYFAEAEATETRLWSADTVCIAANVLSDAVVERDDVAVDGQLDDRRIQPPCFGNSNQDCEGSSTSTGSLFANKNFLT